MASPTPEARAASSQQRAPAATPPGVSHLDIWGLCADSGCSCSQTGWMRFSGETVGGGRRDWPGRGVRRRSASSVSRSPHKAGLPARGDPPRVSGSSARSRQARSPLQSLLGKQPGPRPQSSRDKRAKLEPESFHPGAAPGSGQCKACFPRDDEAEKQEREPGVDSDARMRNEDNRK